MTIYNSHTVFSGETRKRPWKRPPQWSAMTSAMTLGETNYSLIFDIRAFARVSRDGSIYIAPEIVAKVFAEVSAESIQIIILI